MTVEALSCLNTAYLWTVDDESETLNIATFFCELFDFVCEIVEELADMAADTPRVLSIQSHVVHGYVGNKSATFPLQVLGFEVDSINTVQFSTHTAYKHIKGPLLDNKDLEELVEGLILNEVDYYTHFLTGYSRSPDSLKQIAGIIKKLRQKNPKLFYVCDPVMGDNGKMYVPQDILPVYRDIVIPLADIVTPNQFEAELLTGMTMKDIDGALKVINAIHAKGVSTVVLSSTDLGDDKSMIGIASTKGSCYKIEMPKVDATYVGTGDLFAALFLAWFHKTNNNLKLTLEKTIATMQAIVQDTYQKARDIIATNNRNQKAANALPSPRTKIEYFKCSYLADCLTLHTGTQQYDHYCLAAGLAAKHPSGKIPPALVELRLIQNKAVIENPKIVIEAVEIKK